MLNCDVLELKYHDQHDGDTHPSFSSEVTRVAASSDRRKLAPCRRAWLAVTWTDLTESVNSMAWQPPLRSAHTNVRT